MIPSINIDSSELTEIAKQLSATPKQVGLSVRRAAKRTNTTVAKKARMLLLRKLNLRRATAIRRRIKKLRFVKSNIAGFWIGTNPLPISDIKGQPTQASAGVQFQGELHRGAFIGRFRGTGRKRVLRRYTRSRLPIGEVGHPIHDESVDLLEQKILSDIPDIFLSHFKKDLTGRVRYLK